jgi:hypothetical protein
MIKKIMSMTKSKQIDLIMKTHEKKKSRMKTKKKVGANKKALRAASNAQQLGPIGCKNPVPFREQKN